MRNKKIPEKFQIWIEVRKRFHLSHAHIQMARELSMNPKKLGKLANHKQESWKSPLPIFIEQCYSKRFKKEKPEIIKSIEQLVYEKERKKAEQKKVKEQKKLMK